MTKKQPAKTVFLPPTRVNEDLRDRVFAEADRKQTSVGALVREALLKLLSKRKV